MTTERSNTPPATITQHEAQQIERANATGRTPVVFVHGLWLLPSSWDRWATMFEEAGYTTLTPGWPDDPETVDEANAHPEVFAHKTVGQVADHFDEIIRGLTIKPAVIGHSFGGLLVQMLSGRGLEERYSAGWYRKGLIEILGLCFAHRVRETIAELLERQRDRAVAIGGVAEDGPR